MDPTKEDITQMELADKTPATNTVAKPEDENLVYADDAHEPVLYARTWIAVSTLCFWSFAQLFAILGPPTIVGAIAADLGGSELTTWVVNAPVLVQAAIINPLCSASDIFQSRKLLLVACCVLSFVGAAIVPGSTSIGRLIAGQTLIGFGNAAQGLAFSVPAEILPRRWRPMAQAIVLAAGSLAMITAPITIGALTRDNISNWRKFYWIETALWGATALGILVGYRPPKRHTRLDHLSLLQKIKHLDLIGFGLLTAGLVILLAGLSMGGSQHPWASAPTLSTLIIGIVVVAVFGVYEWKGTSTGILHHELFRHGSRSRTFVICCILIFIEGMMLYPFILFYPVLTQALFEQDLVIVCARVSIYYGAFGVSNLFWGYLVVKLRSIREVLMAGFGFYLLGTILFCTVQPGQNANVMAFAAISGFGIGSVLPQVMAGAQLVSPHALLATATAVALSIRAIATASFVPIYNAVVNQNLTPKLTSYIGKVASDADLPAGSIDSFVEAITAKEANQVLLAIPGVTQVIIAKGVHAYQQAYADSIRLVFVVSVPFVLVGTVICWWLTDLKKDMNYHVDAPVEKLNAKVVHDKSTVPA